MLHVNHLCLEDGSWVESVMCNSEYTATELSRYQNKKPPFTFRFDVVCKPIRIIRIQYNYLYIYLQKTRMCRGKKSFLSRKKLLYTGFIKER